MTIHHGQFHNLTDDGGRQQNLHRRDSTRAPVVTWTAIRFLLTASLINDWHTRQIDFVLAHPQAKVSHETSVT